MIQLLKNQYEEIVKAIADERIESAAFPFKVLNSYGSYTISNFVKDNCYNKNLSNHLLQSFYISIARAELAANSSLPLVVEVKAEDSKTGEPLTIVLDENCFNYYWDI